MVDGRTALLFLYALFWATTLGAVVRHNGFPTEKIWGDKGKRCKRVARLIVSILILNLFPVFCLVVLYTVVVPEDSGIVPIIIAAIASLSMFGIIRLYHGFVASKETINMFYTLEEQDELDIQGAGCCLTPFLSHFVPGLLYFVIFGGGAWVLKKLLWVGAN